MKEKNVMINRNGEIIDLNNAPIEKLKKMYEEGEKREEKLREEIDRLIGLNNKEMEY